MTNEASTLPRLSQWTLPGRLFVFVLSATSIWCLLAEFYHLCSMRTFTLAVFLPASVLLVLLATQDGWRGDGRLWRGILIGVVAGFVAAVAYDIFRLPFVYSREWGLTAVVPPLKLFKVFPRFGAMILGQPIEQPSYSLAAHLIGWAYHFSNGMTFGVMYVAIVGTNRVRAWGWAVVMAVGLEIAMLATPYRKVFAIPLTGAFIFATLTAHLIFGVVMGLCARWLDRRWAAARSMQGQIN